MTAPEIATLEEFAALARIKPRYARELLLRGRLVLTDDGQVRVRESAERMRDTAVRDVLPAECTLTDFALLANVRQSYASQLKADGRLVMTDDGKRVRVAESLAQIRATTDPSKAGVAARHAEARGAAVGVPPVSPAQGACRDRDVEPDDVDDDGDEADTATPPTGRAGRAGSAYQVARALREQHMAELAGMDLAARRGELLDRDAVRAACSDAVTQFRTRLEGLATTLGPQLAPVTDEGRCTAMLAEHIGHLLEELERKFKAMTPEVGT